MELARHRYLPHIDLMHYPQALPSYSTFRRTFLQIPPQGWLSGFNQWAAATLPEIAAVLWSIDGKSIRCTSRGGNTSAQDFTSLVSVYAQSLGVLHLALMQNRAVSEIHVAQASIAELPHLLPGQCFSLDALHTTAATVDTITRSQQHYLLAVKQNRADAYAAIEQIVEQHHPTSTASEQDDSHLRSVTRTAQVFLPTEPLQSRWSQLATVGVVHRSGWRDQKAFSQMVYYITNAQWTAAQLLTATRQHWQIENGLHWVKDVTLQEDFPPRRGGFAPVHWAILNTFCITLARRQGWRTVPQALRAWANQLNQVFHFFV